MTPTARTPVHTRPKGRRRRAAGPAGASEAVLELGAPLLCCFSSMYLFSFSLLGPSPPAAGPHPCRGSRCRQKAIQGPIRTLHSRLETNPGTEEKEATGVGWRDQTWMETKTRTQEEGDGGGAPGRGRGEKGNQRQAETMEGRALTAAPGLRLCGRPAATAPSAVPSLCSQGQGCALSPGAPCLLHSRHSSLHLLWDCQGCQSLIGPQNC